MRNIVNILGVNIDNTTMDDAADRICTFVKQKKVRCVYTPNSEIIMEAYRNNRLMEILNEGDMVIPDGAGVILASKILGKSLSEKVSGIDLIYRILTGPRTKNCSIFILGGKPGVAEKACINITGKYPSIKIAGYCHGYFSDEEEDGIIKQVNKSGADILLAGLGAPKQEQWIHTNKDKLAVKVCMGVGGSIDIIAGTSRLAPEFIRKAGFEWLYRLSREPKRYRRMLDLPRFMIRVLKERLALDRKTCK